MTEDKWQEQLTLGLHCKACNAPLKSTDIDPELCGECMMHVMEYNKDIMELEDEPPTEAIST